MMRILPFFSVKIRELKISSKLALIRKLRQNEKSLDVAIIRIQAIVVRTKKEERR